jgi:membrane fusion protein (multidrug efflux system)
MNDKTPRPMLRMIITVGIAVLVIGIAVAWHLIQNHFIAAYASSGVLPPATVTTLKAEMQPWQPQLTAVSSLRASRGVDVTTELDGMVSAVHFSSGANVKAGDLLLELNTDADVAQLHALQASADLAAKVLERSKAQFAVEAISHTQLDTDAADLESKQALVAQQQALVTKKAIHAPFGGRLGINTVVPGQYIKAGDALVTLQALNPLYADFDVPQQEVARLSTGQTVTLSTDAYPGQSFSGTVHAINSKIDATTRNLQIEAVIDNSSGRLLPGMFGNIAVDMGAKQSYVTLPQSAITYNPYGATVFLATTVTKTDKNTGLEAHQVFVTTGATRGDQVAVTGGIKADDVVVTSGQLKLTNGTPLNVDNSVPPKNDPNPTPQEQ